MKIYMQIILDTELMQEFNPHALKTKIHLSY